MDVVMGVQQHGRGAGWPKVAGDHRRGSPLGHDLHVAEPRRRQQFCHRGGAALHLAAAGRVGPHRLDADEIFQIAAH